ncbi:hypothetical protein BKA69DRAFT_1042126 [Paraphysoderma sedebokerense]|nr:hypothetical protein BKA69DRAFT_1042126 [Paraphysoderma sedebokerense]
MCYLTIQNRQPQYDKQSRDSPSCVDFKISDKTLEVPSISNNTIETTFDTGNAPLSKAKDKAKKPILEEAASPKLDVQSSAMMDSVHLTETIPTKKSDIRDIKYNITKTSNISVSEESVSVSSSYTQTEPSEAPEHQSHRPKSKSMSSPPRPSSKLPLSSLYQHKKVSSSTFGSKYSTRPKTPVQTIPPPSVTDTLSSSSFLFPSSKSHRIAKQYDPAIVLYHTTRSPYRSSQPDMNAARGRKSVRPVSADSPRLDLASKQFSDSLRINERQNDVFWFLR